MVYVGVVLVVVALNARMPIPLSGKAVSDITVIVYPIDRFNATGGDPLASVVENKIFGRVKNLSCPQDLISGGIVKQAAGLPTGHPTRATCPLGRKYKRLMRVQDKSCLGTH